jgi:YidC/Oxa1 family membrane protein insertase
VHAHNVLHLPAGKTTPCGPGHGAGFLFIHDLTDKATGATLIVLIVLYVASQVGSTLLMSTTMDKTQRNLMLFLPLIFVIFVIRFPAGLIVYWITTNLWTVVQQYFVRKRVGPLQPAPAASGGGGGGLLGGLLGGGSRGDAPSGGGGGGSSGGRGRDGGGAAAEPAAGSGRGAKAKTTSNGASAESRRSSKPPPPPRKKKKRSGRRR